MRTAGTVQTSRYSGGAFRVAVTNASNSSKNFVMQSVRASSLDTNNLWWQVQDTIGAKFHAR